MICAKIPELYNDGIFSGTRINGLERVLGILFNTSLNAESANASDCAEAVQRYLCYYYFPVCNMTTNEIVPVCTDTCELLYLNDDCLGLLVNASVDLMRESVPVPDDSCTQTSRSFSNVPMISNNCTAIEG